MDDVHRLGNSITIPIPADENAFTGRECPQPDCEGWGALFKGKSRFAAWTHQAWVDWVRQHQTGRWKAWLEWIEARYGYGPIEQMAAR